MKMTLIAIVIGALGTIPKGFVRWLDELEIRERADTIKATIFFRSARILRKILAT